jgi:hypothetical protein
MMTELAIRDVENHGVHDLRPVGAIREENKLRFAVDEVADQPRQATRSILIFRE